MSADVNNGTVKLEGFDDLAAKLRAIVPALRKRVLRNALAAGARLVRDDAKKNAPELSERGARRARKFRTQSLLKKSIVVRTSKIARRAGDVGVFVNVKPAKGGQRGAKSRTDPFYWKFLEFGWNPAGGDRTAAGKRKRRKLNKAGVAKRKVGLKFLTNASSQFPAALRIFESKVAAWFAKTNASGKVDP